MQWDDEVDVVCTGSGAGGWASALVAADAGLTVVIADSNCGYDDYDSTVPLTAGLPVADLETRLANELVDRETIEYFDALAPDLGSINRFLRDADLPVRVVADPSVRRSQMMVETFVGARLRDWAAQCVASPYGVMYSQVSDRNMITTHSRGGEAIEAALIGRLDLDPEQPGPALDQWLSGQVRDRDIEIYEDSPLQRLVFDDGQVVGAVVDTPEGAVALRARRNVVVATGRFRSNTGLLGLGPVSVHVCVVSQIASRFARVELLTQMPLADPALRVAPALVHRTHANLRKHPRAHSVLPRYRKLHG